MLKSERNFTLRSTAAYCSCCLRLFLSVVNLSKTGRGRVPYEAGFQGRSSTSRSGWFQRIPRQVLLAHVGSQGLIIISHWHKFHPDSAGFGRKQRIPHIRAAIVFRPSQHAHIYEMPIAGEWPVPLDPRMRDADDVGLREIQQVFEKAVRTGGFPEKFIHFTRRAVAEQHLAITQSQSACAWKCPQPGF